MYFLTKKLSILFRVFSVANIDLGYKIQKFNEVEATKKFPLSEAEQSGASLEISSENEI